MSWEATTVVVGGLGVSGEAAARALVEHGARVTVLDQRDDQDSRRRADALERLGAGVVLGPEGARWSGPDPDLVVVSPGLSPRTPLLRQATERGVAVWSEVELAWRLRRDPAAPWLCVSGTNGKTTTVRMLAAMLTAAGRATVAVGNVGTPVSTVVASGRPYDVLVVELSSFQLHHTRSVTPQAAALLNVAPDHLDWYAGSLGDYTADKARVYAGAERACVYNAADPVTERLARTARTAPGCRVAGVTSGPPGAGMLGVTDGVLVDRAFTDQAAAGGAALAAVADVWPAAEHNVTNALAAAALARANGVAASAVAAGLRAFRPDPHRIAEVATIAGARYVDDSKATNPHAALASLSAFAPVVWVAGGLAKEADFDDLVRAVRDRLRAVILIGRDRDRIGQALARHAPDVPVVVVAGGKTVTVMDRVVAAATTLSRPGDTVLLAPGCASQDMFADYGQRGDAFAAAAQRSEQRGRAQGAAR